VANVADGWGNGAYEGVGGDVEEENARQLAKRGRQGTSELVG